MLNSRMKRVSDIFDAFGGPARFARCLDIGNSTASEMKRRRSIPVEYWPNLIRQALAEGIDLTNDDLVRIHVDERKTHAEAAQ